MMMPNIDLEWDAANAAPHRLIVGREDKDVTHRDNSNRRLLLN